MANVLTEELVGMIKKCKLEWESDSTADVEFTSVEYYNGMIKGLYTIPGTGGSAPSDNYDVVANDKDGIDILNGQGANRSATLTQRVFSSLGLIANSQITFVISNAGEDNSGTIIVYIEE